MKTWQIVTNLTNDLIEAITPQEAIRKLRESKNHLNQNS